MPYRSPARFFAPLALIATAFAIYALAQPTADSGSASTSTPAARTASVTPAKRKASPNGLQRAARYTIKPNDTLSGIAAKSGLTMQHIESLNPGLDPNTLAVGGTLKLRR